MKYCPLEKEVIDDCGVCEMCPDQDDEEMSDLEMWDEMKKESRNKKERNRESSYEILIREKIPFKKLTDYHYRLAVFDFWPSTGKYWNRASNKYGRGGIQYDKGI